MRGKPLGAIISKLAFTCTVYNIWLARNSRIFANDKPPEEVVLKNIVNMIRFRALSLKNLKRNASDDWFLATWRLPNDILFGVND